MDKPLWAWEDWRRDTDRNGRLSGWHRRAVFGSQVVRRQEDGWSWALREFAGQSGNVLAEGVERNGEAAKRSADAAVDDLIRDGEQEG